MHIRTITLSLCALLFSVAASAQVSSYDQLRTNSWSIYGLGGVSAATGEKLFENVTPSPDTYVAPMAGAGVTWNIRPWVRMNLGYETSKYRREQRLALPQDDGLAYRSLEVLYNDVELNGELNIMELFKNRESKKFNLYLGSGIGEMFAYGYDYTVKMGQKETEVSGTNNDSYSFKAWLKAHNNSIGHCSPYIPVNLSAEYDIAPRVSVGLRASLKYILNKEAHSLPTWTESLGVVLRYNFLGLKHGYTSQKRQIAALQDDLGAANASNSALQNQVKKLSDDLASKSDEAAALNKVIEDLQKRLDECGADKATVKRLMEEIRDLKAEQYVVYFDNDSAVLTSKAKATIAEAVARMQAEPEVLTVITASCSNVGSEEYNKALSDRRAEAVRQAFAEAGIAADRISDIISLGEEGMTAAATCRRAIIDVR